jgi:hypothetical protein
MTNEPTLVGGLLPDVVSPDAAALLAIIESEFATRTFDRRALVQLLHIALQRMSHRCLEDCVLELHAKGKIQLVD